MLVGNFLECFEVTLLVHHLAWVSLLQLKQQSLHNLVLYFVQYCWIEVVDFEADCLVVECSLPWMKEDQCL